MTIREATLSDASAIAKITVDAWKFAHLGIVGEKHYNGMDYEDQRRFYAGFLASKKNSVFLEVAIDVFGNIIGYVAGGHERTGKYEYKGEVYALYILPPHHGQGLGRQLFKTAAARFHSLHYSSVMLWVLENNPFCAFYEKLGGVIFDRKLVSIDGLALEEVAYGWKDITTI